MTNSNDPFAEYEAELYAKAQKEIAEEKATWEAMTDEERLRYIMDKEEKADFEEARQKRIAADYVEKYGEPDDEEEDEEESDDNNDNEGE